MERRSMNVRKMCHHCNHLHSKTFAPLQEKPVLMILSYRYSATLLRQQTRILRCGELGIDDSEEGEIWDLFQRAVKWSQDTPHTWKLPFFLLLDILLVLLIASYRPRRRKVKVN
tara:strand:+ start:233 stop:574 length:342 start_codon:yes stop_codon:yes gene_type:complete